MNSVTKFLQEIGTTVLGELSNIAGMIFAMIVFILISFALCYYLIRRNCRNVLISDLLYDEYRSIRDKYRSDTKDSSNYAIKLLRINKYSFMGGVWLILIKCFLGLIFAYGTAAEAEAGLIKFPFPFEKNLMTIINEDLMVAISMTFMALISCGIQYYISNTISKLALVDTSLVDISGTSLMAIICFFAPVGFILFMDVFNFLEFVLFFYTIRTKRESNLERIKPHLLHLDLKEKPASKYGSKTTRKKHK